MGVWKDGGVEIVPNPDGARTTPSVVAWAEDGRLVGAGAKSQAARNPAGTVCDAGLLRSWYLVSSLNTKMILRDLSCILAVAYQRGSAENHGARCGLQVRSRSTTRSA